MHTLILVFKAIFITVTIAGLVYGYWVLFLDEEWEWGIGSLIGDFFRSFILLGYVLIAPHKITRLFTEMGPVMFLLGLAGLIGGLSWLGAYTLGLT